MDGKRKKKKKKEKYRRKRNIKRIERDIRTIDIFVIRGDIYFSLFPSRSSHREFHANGSAPVHLTFIRCL